jgi:serpin B
MRRDPIRHLEFGLVFASWSLVAVMAVRGADLPSDRAALAATARSNNAMALDLYHSLARGDLPPGENLLISPYGLSSNLAILHAGARGETAAGLAKVLHLAGDEPRPVRDTARVAAALAVLQSSRFGAVLSAEGGTLRVDEVLPGGPAALAKLRPGDRILSVAGRTAASPEELDRLAARAEGPCLVELRDGKTDKVVRAKVMLPSLSDGDRHSGPVLLQAHAVWTQKGLEYQPGFLATLKDQPVAIARQADFALHADQAVAEINAWVDEATAHKVPGLFDSLAPTTSLVAASAIYFNGAWAVPFDPANSHPGKFRVRPDRFADVTFMESTQSVRILEPAGEDGLIALELPYRGTTLIMEVLLPAPAHGLADVEPRLTAEDLERWSDQLHKTPASLVKLTLPRFRLDSKLLLNRTLADLGMSAAFGAQADFSGIAGGKTLPLSQVFQRAFIDVNEQGTEAAAATGASAARFVPRTITVDRPFVFLIRDVYSGTIFFMGRVADPTR